MTIYFWFGIISPFVSAIGYIPYVVSIVKGKTKPHPFSWFLWSIVGATVLFFCYAVGARDTLPLAVLNFIGPTCIFLFSARYWEGKFSFFDYACLVLSLVSIVVYLLFHNAAVSLTIALVSDFFAYLPTIRKTYLHPEQEDFLTWIFFTTGPILSILAVSSWTYAIGVFPVYLTTLSVVMCILLLRGRLKKTS